MVAIRNVSSIRNGSPALLSHNIIGESIDSTKNKKRIQSEKLYADVKKDTNTCSTMHSKM